MTEEPPLDFGFLSLLAGAVRAGVLSPLAAIRIYRNFEWHAPEPTGDTT